MSVDLAVQKAIRARLVASAEVTVLVPAASILDRHARPAPRPGIIIGDAQTVRDEGLDRRRVRVFHDLHVWTREPSTEVGKRIMGAVAVALRGRLDLGDGLHCADCRVTGTRVMRDPDGETTHGVLGVEALALEAAP